MHDCYTYKLVSEQLQSRRVPSSRARAVSSSQFDADGDKTAKVASWLLFVNCLDVREYISLFTREKTNGIC